MNSIRRSNPILAGRISAWSPILAALALGWTGVQAHALDTATAETLLADQLQGFSFEETTGAAKVYGFASTSKNTTVTAPANDLVYAVYRIAANGQGIVVNNAADLATLITTALMPVNGKSRTDINTTAPRILHAALFGVDFGGNFDATAEPATITAALDAIVGSSVNGTGKITTAGKEALVAMALKSADASAAAGTAIATDVLSSSAFTSLEATDTTKQSLAIAVLKLVSTSTSQVQGFAQTYLEGVATANRDTVAVKVAEGIATNPVAAGAVIGGRAAGIESDNGAGTNQTNTEITALLGTVLADTKLAKAIEAAVGTALPSFGTSASDRLTEAGTLITNLAATKETTAVKSAVTGGYLLALGSPATSTDVTNAVTALADIHAALKSTELATFAAAAAAHVPALAGDLAATLGARVAVSTQKTEDTALTGIATAVLKSIATTGAEVNFTDLASDVITAGNTGTFASSQAFSTDALKEAFAVSLAKAAPTNGTAVAGAVDGVAESLTLQNEMSLNALASKSIIAAPKAAINIAEALTTRADTTAYGMISATTFAAGLVLDTTDKFPATAAASVAAGASLTNPDSAGTITLAVINASATLQTKAVSIASTVAGALDIEHIAALGEAVAGALPTVANGSGKLPTFAASIGTLALDLGKAINAKPTEATENKVDELGELAASLADAAVTAIGTGAANDTNLEKSLEAIGASLFKSLSTKLQMNGGSLPADLQDAAQYIAGSIAQAVSYHNASIGQTEINTILNAVAAVLAKDVLTAFPAAKTKPALNPVTIAVGEVIGAGAGNLVPGGQSVDGTHNGKYEIGNFVDGETPITNS